MHNYVSFCTKDFIAGNKPSRVELLSQGLYVFLILINVTTMYFKKEPVAIDALVAMHKKGLSLPVPH